MSSNVKRLLVEKREGFDLEAKALMKDLKDSLHIDCIDNLRLLNRYDIEGLSDEVCEYASKTIFSEPNLDIVYNENVEYDKDAKVFAVEYLPGQYDQRADWAAQCVQIINEGQRPNINSAKLYILSGKIDDKLFDKIKSYIINPVDSREANLEKPVTLEIKTDIPTEVETITGFIDFDKKELENFLNKQGLAMTIEDLEYIQEYFKNQEKRNPTITEIKVLDTYWSDHCRHTTFMTQIKNVEIEDGKFNEIIKETYSKYIQARNTLYIEKQKDMCLMDIATIAVKELKNAGKLDDLDESEEINACSINIDVNVDRKIPIDV